MYDFSSLNPFDFEKLVCDLLNKSKKEHNRYQSFKEGRDYGIDLISENNENENEIVQVKHYVKSSVTKLKYDLKNSELKKLKNLNFCSYYIVTSASLSYRDKEEIKEIFSPYIKNTQNILGKDDINDLLRLYPEVEMSHYKLWFSSTVALKKINNYRFEGRRKQFKSDVLKRNIRLFVHTHDYYQAIDNLNKNKYIIITGEPGVGKTTLSDMVVYSYLEKNFDITIIYDHIGEIEDKLIDDDSKQVFYFDDFLGHTHAEIQKSKSAENYLLKIINRIESSVNKFLILNTRKFILSSFLEESERFKHINFLHSESRITITSYSYGAKRRILDNHIFESKISSQKKQILNKLAHEICIHKNFSPRIIEFFTNNLMVVYPYNKYEDFINNNLKNPKEIWKQAYINQISDYDRFFLNTIFSLNNYWNIKKLEFYYNKRLNFEVKNNNYRKPINSFNKCLRILNNGFISVSDYYDQKVIYFINPSLEDFIFHFLKDNSLETHRILESSISILQWYRFYFKSADFKIDYEKSCLFKIKYLDYLNNDKNTLLTLLFFHFYIPNDNIETINNLIRRISNWELIYENNDEYVRFLLPKFMKEVKSNRVLNNTISSFNKTFFFYFIYDYDNLEDLIERSLLLKKHYNFCIKKYIEAKPQSEHTYHLIEELKENIHSLYEKQISESIEFLKTSNSREDYLDEILQAEEKYNIINNYILSDFKFDISLLKNKDWERIREVNSVEEPTKYIKKTYINYEEELENYNLLESNLELLDYDLLEYYNNNLDSTIDHVENRLNNTSNNLDELLF